MNKPQHRREDVSLMSVFRKDGKLYTVVGIADSPTIEILEVISRRVENHVISSPNFAEFEHLQPAVACAHIPAPEDA